MIKSIGIRLMAVALLLCLGWSLAAQPKIAYIGMSAVLPGSGEIARGHSHRGAALLASDILALSAFLKTDSQINAQERAFQDYATHYAGLNPNRTKSYYQAMQNYYSSADYNEYVEMVLRNKYLIDTYDPDTYAAEMAKYCFTETESWRWQSPRHWEYYKSLRRKQQKSRMNHNLALGIMLFNRAVSVLDNAILKGPGQLQAAPCGADGISLGYEINF